MNGAWPLGVAPTRQRQEGARGPGGSWLWAVEKAEQGDFVGPGAALGGEGEEEAES